tara:strand:- start:3946 stop:4209 length:264 start_codon:yes stop_codon:yes gene_type:complete
MNIIQAKDTMTGEVFRNVIIGTHSELRLLRVAGISGEGKVFFGPLDDKEVQMKRFIEYKKACDTKSSRSIITKRVVEIPYFENFEGE